jgi:hypothetical protein
MHHLYSVLVLLYAKHLAFSGRVWREGRRAVWRERVISFFDRRVFHLSAPAASAMACSSHSCMILLTLFLQAPRGLSAAEKRDKLLEIFHETVSRPPCIRRRVVPLRRRGVQKDFWQVVCGAGRLLQMCLTRRLAEGTGEARAEDEGHRYVRARVSETQSQ